jgi:branched-subunit amino acid aminotransferase/4-amino-4-deoxychorismate lyase
MQPSLIETMRVVEGRIPLLGAHVQRYQNSARQLGYVVAPLGALAAERSRRSRARVLRAQLSPEGAVEWSARAFRPPILPLRVGLSQVARVLDDPLLQVKSTRREVYNEASAEAAERGLDAVVLRSLEGRATETSIHSLLYRLDGRWWTPPLADGLLRGVLRGELLRRGVVAERSLLVDEVHRHRPRIALCNAVVGIVPAVWDGFN